LRNVTRKFAILSMAIAGGHSPSFDSFARSLKRQFCGQKRAWIDMKYLDAAAVTKRLQVQIFALALACAFSVAQHSIAAEVGAAPLAAEAPIAPKTVSDGSAVGDIQAASEDIEVGKNASAGNLVTSSGAVRIGAGSSVASITTQIGAITLGDGAMVVKDIVVEAGTITIGKGSIVMGRINVIRPAKGVQAALKIVIEEGSAVQGGVMMGYPVQICVGKNASAGRISGGKALKCKP
jgi:hypothetical protein